MAAVLTVVIPTRNRPELAVEAVDSALGAGESRVRVLLSDNSSEPGAVEKLADAAGARDDERLRYVRAPQPPDMSAHWQWALDQALEDSETTHVAFLTDRMVFHAGAVAGLLALVAAHPDAVATFPYDTLDDSVSRPRVLQPEWTNRLLEVRSEHLAVAAARRGAFHVAMPRMLNTVAPRAAFDAIRDRFGSVFASVAPDFCFGYRCLDTFETFLYWDRPLLVQRGLNRSNGHAQTRGIANRDARDFQESLAGESLAPNAPVPEFQTVFNVVYNEYELARRQSPGPRLPPLRMNAYLSRMAADVALFEDGSPLATEMTALLERHGWSRGARRRERARTALLAAPWWAAHPAAVALRLRERGSVRTKEHPDAASALAAALDQPRDAMPQAGHLWLLLRPSGGAMDLRPPQPA